MWHFLRYDNTVPIVLGIVFLGATGAFAATNPEAIYSAEERVLSVDNTYLANKDLTDYTPRATITNVTEDEENYYVAFTFATIDNKDYVWQDVVNNETMVVSKADLGQYRDLGLYVTEQLRQKVGRELARLRETQEIEKKAVSQKMVATEYGGLIGKFLDDTMETLPGYVPVVTPPVVAVNVPEPDPPPVPAPEDAEAVGEGEVLGEDTEGMDESGTEEPTSISLQILGENPVRVVVGASYTDLGAVLEGDTDAPIDIFVNNEPVTSVVIDTSATSAWRIRYEARGIPNMNATRIVVVYEPEPEAPPAESPTETPSETPDTSTTTPEETPAPTPETSEEPAQVPEEASEGTPTQPAETPDTPGTEPTSAAPSPEPAAEPAIEPAPESLDGTTEENT